MELETSIIDLLQKINITGDLAINIKNGLIILLILISSVVANYITKKFIMVFISRLIIKSKNEYDDVFLEKKVFDRLSHIVPALIIYYTIGYALPESPEITSFFMACAQVYMIIAIVLFIDAFLNAAHEIYLYFKISKRIPIKGYIQVLKIVIYFVAIILVISTIMQKSPIGIFTGIGALAAVLMLIFKDTILGFVASIQLTAYNMVKPGDWIAMRSRNADGTVIDISLSTVKVQNFDKTVSTIPTYSLVSESFTNYKGMIDAGARRIKRSLNIDLSSICFCDDAMLDKYEKIELLSNYIKDTRNKVKNYNKSRDVSSTIVNGKTLTNIGTFRKYIELYLRNNIEVVEKEDVKVRRKVEVEEKGKMVTREVEVIEKQIKVSDGTKNVIKPGNFNEETTLLVRQLAPTEKGLPIEIYVFASTTAWGDFEAIQADLFDHLFAILPEFGLRVFQSPSGNDIEKLHGNNSL